MCAHTGITALFISVKHCQNVSARQYINDFYEMSRFSVINMYVFIVGKICQWLKKLWQSFPKLKIRIPGVLI